MADKKLTPWQIALASVPTLGKKFTRAYCKKHGEVFLNNYGKCAKCVNAVGRQSAGPQQTLQMSWDEEDMAATRAGECNYHSHGSVPYGV